MLWKIPTSQAVHPSQTSQDPARCTTGNKVMKGYHHDKDARADAGAEWIIRPGSLRPTVTMAARATGTTPYRIRRALERRGHLVKRPRIAPIEAAWSRTTRAEFEAFYVRHFDALYRGLDRATTKMTV